MFYLVDDSDLKSLNAEFVFDSKYQQCLSIVQSMQAYNELKRNDAFTNAECLMCHKTFCNSEAVYHELSDLASDSDKNIPLVAFSGGISNVSADKNQLSIQIGKSLFYSRLRAFLDHFINKAAIDLRLIAEGDNYVANDAKRCIIDIKRIINGNKGIIDDIAINEICGESFKRLVELSSPAIGSSYLEIADDLEDNPISYSDFRMRLTKIEESFNQYGKNIYPWKS